MNQTHRALAEHIDTELSHDIGEVTAVGWHGPVNMTFDEWCRVGNTLLQIDSSINWWVGDWLNYGESKWGEMYAQAIEATGWKYERLARAKWVASAVKFCLRRQNLSWTHHQHIAKLPTDAQQYWLDKAEKEGLRSGELREAIAATLQIPSPIAEDKDDGLPFSSVSPQVHRNGNGHYTPVDEYEQADPILPDSRMVYGPIGRYWQFRDTKQCTKCGQLWIVDLDYCPYCNVSPEARSLYLQEERSNGTPHVSHNSGNNEWYTPSEIIFSAQEVMGCIDLDPASSDKANEIVQAATYFTAEDDGLSKYWTGKVWMNPPYSSNLIVRFCEKLATHYETGDVVEAIALVNNATETEWFTILVEKASAIVFPRSRVRFWKPDGELGAPLQGQALIYMGSQPRKFMTEFEKFGWGAYLE